MRPPTRTARPAFSLVELIVVIAIVGLLTAVLLPALAGARRRAQSAVCLSNARQIVLAINADASANGGKLPENRTRLPDTAERTRPEHVTWRHRFAAEGLTTDPGVWECPAHPGKPGSELNQWDNTTYCVGDLRSSYALNGHVIWRPDVGGEEAVLDESFIKRPSHTILLAESRARFPDIRITDNLVAADFPDGGFYGFWHAGGGTYAFQDGHAETIGFMDTGNPDCRWHNGLDLSEDRFDKQNREETRMHDHPDWEFLVHEVYLR
jgi:prepilin-type N-terminal cleavage/methylation domain-containing protein/prepilin-type processing-associated H-X9-DG protein